MATNAKVNPKAAYETSSQAIDPAKDAPSPTPEINDTPPGVVRVEIIAEHLTLSYRIAIFGSIFLVGFSYGLAAMLANVYQTYATASYSTHSLLATSNTLRTVFAVAAQPAAAKLADIFGRFQLIYLCATFYLVGLIVESCSTNVTAFVAGAVLNQVGLSTTQVMVEMVIADFSSTRGRLFFYTVPNMHFIVTTWISGNISDAVLKTTTWRWGIGMWCIVYAVCILPFIATMLLAERHARACGAVTKPKPKVNFVRNLRKVFWEVDTPGLVLLIAALALILTPLTLVGGVQTKWNSPDIVAPIVVGFICVPAFVVWETRAPHPMIPFKQLRDRSIWGALGTALFFNFAVALQRDFLYTVLVVAFDYSVASATRVSSLYGFMAFVTGPLTGLAVYRVRHLRPFMLSGLVIFTVAFGLLVRFRGGDGTAERAGLIAGQVLLGLGSGLFGYSASVGMQASAKHQHVGVLIALYLALHNIGGGFGSSVSGAIWTRVLPETLASKLGDPTLAAQVFANPFPIVAQYPVGTVIRDSIIESYQHVQRLLCATGLGLCVPMIAFAAMMRDPELTDEQSLVKDDDEK